MDAMEAGNFWQGYHDMVSLARHESSAEDLSNMISKDRGTSEQCNYF